MSLCEKKWDRKGKVVDNSFVNNVALHIMNENNDIEGNSLKNFNVEIIDKIKERGFSKIKFTREIRSFWTCSTTSKCIYLRKKEMRKKNL